MRFRAESGNRRGRGWLLACAALALTCAGCRLDMHVQPRYNPYDPSTFFTNGMSARLPVPGTVPRGPLRLSANELLYSGKIHGQLANVFPFPITQGVLERGRQRYNIFCSPCHGLSGDGDGMIVQRGFRQPPSYHIERLMNAPVGHFFDVITNGFGVMFPYGYRVSPRDRWAIVAYIRALQLSRRVSINDVPQPERNTLLGGSQ